MIFDVDSDPRRICVETQLALLGTNYVRIVLYIDCLVNE